MITTTRSLNFRLPQLSIKNLEKSREKSNKPTIRSINNVYDYSNSPPKTRTDNISRGSLSTPLQYCRYSCYNICRVDSSFNDQEIFSAQQKSVQRNENSKNIISDQIEKLSQRIKNLSKTKKKIQESISSKQYKKTEPYIQKQSDKQQQSKSSKLILKTEEKNEPLNLEQKKVIQEKMQDIYTQVQAILKSHKGYVRQSDKKNVYIKLVQLKKQFKLVNQDYNEFYINPINEQFKLDFELVDRIEQLKKLFENKRPAKRNCESLFDGMDISIVIQTEADEKLNNLDFNEISEKDFEQSQDQIEQFTDQMTDCSPANSTTRRRTTNLNKRSTKQYSIQPIQVQQEIITQQPQMIRRKSSIKSINSPLTPKAPDSPSTMTSRNNKFNAQQVLEQKLKLPATPPKKLEQQQFQEDQTIILKKEIQKRQSKLISRKTTLDLQKDPKKKSRANSRNSLVEVTENSENEQKLIPNCPTNQTQISIENKQESDHVQNILDQIEDLNEQIPIEIQQQPMQQIISSNQSQCQPTLHQMIQESKIIQELYQSTFIYDKDIVNKHRKNKYKTQWEQDIQSILSNYYQFF